MIVRFFLWEEPGGGGGRIRTTNRRVVLGHGGPRRGHGAKGQVGCFDAAKPCVPANKNDNLSSHPMCIHVVFLVRLSLWPQRPLRNIVVL